MRERIHYGWIICISCALLIMCSMGLAVNAFTVYMPVIREMNGFSNSQVSLIPTVRSFFALIALFSGGKYFEKLGLRVGVMGAVFFAGSAFLLFSVAKSLLVYYAGAALTGFAYGFGGLVPIGLLINRWFHTKRGLALGLASCGSGIGATIGPPITTMAIRAFGVQQTFFLEGLAILAIGVVVFLLVRVDPADQGLQPYGTGTPQDVAQQNAKPRRDMRRGESICVYVAIAAMGMAIITSPSYFGLHFTSSGFSDMISALAVSLFGLVLAGAKFGLGALIDYIGCRRATGIAFLILFIGLVCCCALSFFPSPVLLFTATALMALGMPPSTVGLPVWANDFSTPEKYPVTLRHFQTANMTGAFLGSSVPGVLADRSGGSYLPGFALHALYALIALVILQIIYRRREREA